MHHRERVRRPLSLLQLKLRPMRSLALVVAALASTAVHAEEPSPVTVLVSDFDVVGSTTIDGETAREVVASRLRRLAGKIDVRSVGEVQSSLDKAALAQMLGGESAEDLESIQRYVQVDRIVTGRVVDVAGVTDVSIRLFHVTEGVMELALSRRVKAGADPALVLTVLEGLADHLLAYVIKAYTDGKASKAFDDLKSKKIALRPAKEKAAETPPPPPSTTARGIGTPIGAFLIGAGAGLLGIGGLLVPVDEDATFGTNLGLVGQIAIPASALALGAVVLGTGAVIFVVDGIE